MRLGDHRKDCCKPEAGNLGPPERYNPERGDLVFRRCKVCNCRHFEAVGEPGVIFSRGASVGR